MASGPGFINGGVYWMKRDILDEIGTPPLSLERDVLPRLAERGLVAGAVYDGRFIDIGMPDDLARGARCCRVGEAAGRVSRPRRRHQSRHGICLSRARRHLVDGAKTR